MDGPFDDRIEARFYLDQAVMPGPRSSIRLPLHCISGPLPYISKPTETLSVSKLDHESSLYWEANAAVLFKLKIFSVEVQSCTQKCLVFVRNDEKIE